MCLLIYIDVVNLKYSTDFDILFIKLVRNTENQFKKGFTYGAVILLIMIIPLIVIRYLFGISFFNTYFLYLPNFHCFMREF